MPANWGSRRELGSTPSDGGGSTPPRAPRAGRAAHGAGPTRHGRRAAVGGPDDGPPGGGIGATAPHHRGSANGTDVPARVRGSPDGGAIRPVVASDVNVAPLTVLPAGLDEHIAGARRDVMARQPHVSIAIPAPMPRDPDRIVIGRRRRDDDHGLRRWRGSASA